MAPAVNVNHAARTAIATTKASTVSPLISAPEQLDSTQATTVSDHAALTIVIANY